MTRQEDIPSTSIAARPLTGRRIAITRPPHQASELAVRLQSLGADVVPLATIAIEPSANFTALDAAIVALASYDWLVFTSANGVRAFAARLAARGCGWDARGRARIAAIGPATAQALAACGAPTAVVPSTFVAEALAAALGNVAGQRILLPRADIAREALARELELRGAEVTEIAAYRTVTRPVAADILTRALVVDPVDAITFTSSSTVRGLVQALEAAGMAPAHVLGDIALVAIGPITAATLRDYHLAPRVVATEYNIEGLLRAIVACFGGEVSQKEQKA